MCRPASRSLTSRARECIARPRGSRRLLDRHLHVGVGPAALEAAAAFARVVVGLRAQHVLARRAENVAVVDVLPSSPIFGRCSVNVTAPGPRCLCHDWARRGMRPANAGFSPSSLCMSSVVITSSVTGWPTVPVSSCATTSGGPWNVLPGRRELEHRRRVALRRVLERLDLVVLDQPDRHRRGLAVGDDGPGEALLAAEVLRHLDGEHAPAAARPGSRWAGPWSGPPGSTRLFGPTGMSSVCFWLRL